MNLKINEKYSSIEKHITNNLIKYSMLLIIFIIGIIVGGICFRSFNNNSENMIQLKEMIEQIINSFADEKWKLVNKYFAEDLIKIALLIITSSSMIGLPLLLVWILYNGVSLSFTINFLIYTYGITKGNFISVLLLFIPNLSMLIATSVITISSIKLIKNIIKNRKPIKIEIIRHLIICSVGAIIIMLGFFWRVFSMNFVENVLNL
ncbi:MAG: hypothetical protein IKK43_03815 [Clostridia bacterium]|nr:hypothetical protein [Clostridia bacterium]